MKELLLGPVLLLLAGLLWAQESQQQPPDTAHLKTQLAQLSGPARLVPLVELAKSLRRLDPAQAVAYGAEAEALLESGPDEELQMRLSNALGRAFFELRDFPKALEQVLRAEALARANGDEAALALALKTNGRISYRSGAYQRGLAVLREAVGLYETLGQPNDLGDAVNIIGSINIRMGNYPVALEDFSLAYQRWEETDNRSGMAAVLNNIGGVYRHLRQPDQALEFYQKALVMREEQGKQSSIAILLNNIGLIYQDQGRFNLALDYFLRSLAIVETLGDKHAEGTGLAYIGRAYRVMGALDQAATYLQRALGLSEDVEDRRGVVSALRELALLDGQRQAYDQALARLQRALALAAEINSQAELQEIYQALSKTYEETGRYGEALNAFQEYERIKSEIFNQQNSETIAEMLARFEADQKQKEIELLEQRQQLDALALGRQRLLVAGLLVGLALLGGLFVARTISERRIRESAQRLGAANEALATAYSDLGDAQDQLIRQERLAAIGRITGTVSHELRNPLGTIQNSLYALVSKTRGKNLGVEPALERIQRNVVRCTELTDELLEFTRVRELIAELTDIDTWLEEILAEEGLLPEGLRVCRQLEAGIEVAIDRERLRRAVINLLLNATQAMAAEEGPSAESEEPTLTVRSRVNRERLELEVSDTGPGIPQDIMPRVFEPLFSTKTFGVGLGLPTVRQIVEQHGGGVEISSLEGNGTTVEFWLPLSNRQ